MRRIRSSFYTSRFTSVAYETSWRGGRGGTHRYLKKGGNGDNIQVMGTSNYYFHPPICVVGASEH